MGNDEVCFPVEEERLGVSSVRGEGQDEDHQSGEDSGEVRASRRVSQPRTPTEQERREHELTHCPYRCWCEHCVRGQGAEYGHSTVVGPAAEEEVPRVIVDYCFLTDNANRRADAGAAADDDENSLTALVMKETLCGSVWAYALQSKSVAEDPWIAEQLVDDLCTIGMAKERIVMKSYQGASIVELQSEVAKEARMC